MTAKVFTTVPGLVRVISEYGTATNDTPAMVPEDVAKRLEDEIRGEVDVEVFVGKERDPKDPTKRLTKTERQKLAGGPRTDIRVERDAPPKAPERPAKGKEA